MPSVGEALAGGVAASRPCAHDVERRDVLAARVLERCRGAGLRVAAAESLTGGLLADAFVRIPGASDVFLGSAVTYDIAAKASVLGVERALLEREGAVHPEVARQMARAAARLYEQPGCVGSVIGLSTTGVAGPGPDGRRPAGLVYIGIALPASASAGDDRGRCRVCELHLSGPRASVRAQSVACVLRELDTLLG